MTTLTVPETRAQQIAPETFLITNLAPAGEGVFVPFNSMVIRGEQPVIIDTSTPAHRANWFRQVLDLVDPEDVRWVFISHDDGDHIGNLHELLEMCPNATLIANFFMMERQAVETHPFPLHRMRWLGPGESLDVGDRRLHLVVPPIFDGPTTRGLFDERTRALWAVDSFAAMTPGEIHRVEDLPADLYDETFTLFNSMISPWHQWLDPRKYRRHTDALQGLGLSTVASSHGPVLTGAAIADAFARVSRLAGEPIVPPPGQPLLDDLIAATLDLVPAQR